MINLDRNASNDGEFRCEQIIYQLSLKLFLELQNLM